MKKIMVVGFGLWFSSAVQAAPILLDSTMQCSAGNAINGVLVEHVTGNNGGATDCWGTFNGNDPGSSGDGFMIGGDSYTFLAKQGTPGDSEGTDIGLVVSPPGGAMSGTWEFDEGALDGHNFLIVLKAASQPGFAVWLFSGGDAASFMGDWSVAWGHNLSHFSIYEGPEEGGDVPVPATLALLGLGLLGMRVTRRRRKT